MRILFLPGSHTSPSSRFRLWQFVEPLRQLGHEVEVRVTTPNRNWASQLPTSVIRRLHNQFGSLARVLSVVLMLHDANKFDVIVMNRDLVPETRVTFLESSLAKRNPRLIFDFDDAIHLGRRGRKLQKILPHFAWITPGNDYLAEFARTIHNNVTIIPTVVDTDKYYVSKERTQGPIRIGWSGSRSTLSYCLPILEEVITELASRYKFEFIVIADVPPSIVWENVNLRYIPWTPDTEVKGLQQMDIGLMPLRDEPFERGKCGLKAIQYMAVGIPAVVSPVGVNTKIVENAVTGFHCSTSEEWIKALGNLIEDPYLRETMGNAGRQRVEAHYSINAVLPQMIRIFEKVRNPPSK